MDCFSDVSGVGIFSDSICVAGTVMLFYSADHCNCCLLYTSSSASFLKNSRKCSVAEEKGSCLFQARTEVAVSSGDSGIMRILDSLRNGSAPSMVSA